MMGDVESIRLDNSSEFKQTKMGQKGTLTKKDSQVFEAGFKQQSISYLL